MTEQISALAVGAIMLGFMLLWVTLLAWTARDSSNIPRLVPRNPNAHVWWANKEWDDDWRREWQKVFGPRG